MKEVEEKHLSNEKTITEIVLTGGPCGGKSTILSAMKQDMEENGYKVLVSKEVASEVMEAGAHPSEVKPYVFQGAIMDTTLNNEKNMKSIAEEYRQAGKNVVIVYDRGLGDSKAYCDKETWETLLKERNLSDEKIRNRYDAVFCIETTAYGAEDVFLKQMTNNPHRYENTIELARETEDKTKRGWTGHKNFYIFKNTDSGWQGKQKAIIDKTHEVLGMQPLVKREDRFLVDVPQDMAAFIKENAAIVQKITQVYLQSNTGTERRIRRIANGKDVSYYYTEKEGVGKARNIREKVISEDMARTLLAQVDSTKIPIKKTRYSFIQGQNHFALDVFPDNVYAVIPKGKAIIEAKGTTEKDSVAVPTGFNNIEAITNDERYSNTMIALRGTRINRKEDDYERG